MAPKSVTFRRHDHLVSVLFGDLLSHSYNITFSMFLDLVIINLIRNDKALFLSWTLVLNAPEHADMAGPALMISISHFSFFMR